MGVAVSPDGTVYIADYANNAIRSVTPDGIIHTVAGTGTNGFSGDRGPANQATMSLPYDVAVDSKGNLYIADHGNSRIRIVSPDKVIRTYAGSGVFGTGCDGLLAEVAPLAAPSALWLHASDTVYFGDAFTVRKISPGTLAQ